MSYSKNEEDTYALAGALSRFLTYLSEIVLLDFFLLRPF